MIENLQKIELPNGGKLEKQHLEEYNSSFDIWVLYLSNNAHGIEMNISDVMAQKLAAYILSL